MAKTVADLAKELNITRQAVLKRIDNLADNLRPKKVGGRYIIESEAEAYIKGFKSDTEKKRQPTDNQPTTNKVVNEVVNLELEVKHLKEQLKTKDKQIDKLHKQADNLHKLLDQQQRLTLVANQEAETLKIEMAENKKPKTLWERIKGK